jgi:predicted transcriptional regulator
MSARVIDSPGSCTTMEYMSNLTVRIPEKLRKELKQMGRQQQRPVSDLVRDSLRRYVAQEQLRQIREKLRPYAEAKGLLTDEDVFKAVS